MASTVGGVKRGGAARGGGAEATCCRLVRRSTAEPDGGRPFQTKTADERGLFADGLWGGDDGGVGRRRRKVVVVVEAPRRGGGRWPEGFGDARRRWSVTKKKGKKNR